MTAWSAWTEPFAVPAGALDVYQSLQHLSPRACVASHYHEGPENGLVVSGPSCAAKLRAGNAIYQSLRRS